MIEKISIKLAVFLKKHVNEKDWNEEDFVKKASFLQIKIYLFLILIIMSIIFDIYFETLISLILVITIRTIGGGNHFKSADICLIVTLITVLLPILLNYFLDEQYYKSIFITVLLFYICFFPHTQAVRKYTVRKKIVIALVLLTSYILYKKAILTPLILIPDLLIRRVKADD